MNSLFDKTCECGCGQVVKPGNRYINGHNWKGKPSHMKGKHLSKETRRKMSLVRIGKKKSEETKEKMSLNHCSLGMKGKKHTKETKRKIGKASKRTWANPEHKEKRLKTMFAAWKRKPTKPEKISRRILNQLFPNEYKYVGNGQVWIGGKNPDFMNINGQKKLIEIFGDFWHGEKYTKRTKVREEGKRIHHFKRYGFKLLIVWERELKDRKKLRGKLLKFHRNHKENLR